MCVWLLLLFFWGFFFCCFFCKDGLECKDWAKLCMYYWVLINHALINFSFYTSDSRTSLKDNWSILLAVYIASLPLTRLAAIGVGVALMVRRSSKLAPSVMACVYLSIGLVLSLMEDFPNFVTNCNGPGNNNSHGKRWNARVGWTVAIGVDNISDF